MHLNVSHISADRARPCLHLPLHRQEDPPDRQALEPVAGPQARPLQEPSQEGEQEKSLF